ncbi:MAG: DEAD/DEAH box helicase [Myxococcales bacterium]|nr:DEAD/DEAH box helicase [Myxococcales bacterium]
MSNSNSASASASTAGAPPSAPASAAPDFASLGVAPTLIRALDEVGHRRPTPIQAAAIPGALAGRDVLGLAQTGTGKTAAFALPILQRLLGTDRGADAAAAPRGRGPAGRRPIRALVLSPTRELASQIGDTFARYGRHSGLRQLVIFGGVGFAPQVSALRQGVDVLVATPGRLVDLLEQGHVELGAVEVLVLDEADRMLDAGFLPGVRRILRRLPGRRQTLFFSATMPDELVPLTGEVLDDPLRVAVAPVASTPDKVDQSVYLVSQADKRRLLEHVLQDSEVSRAIVFTRTKHGADRVARQLAAVDVAAAAIHGNKSQNARERALASFRAGGLRILVATDVAARGIDIGGVSHVLNYDMPMDPEGYVHRIGRTARAGATGVAISFCSIEERPRLASVEKLIKRRLPVVGDHPFVAGAAAPKPESPQPAPRRAPAGGRPGQGSRSGQGQGPRQGQGRSQSQGAAQSGGRRTGPSRRPR